LHPDVLMRSLTCTLLIVAGLGWGGCTSRTTPLPPPEVTTVSKPSADGLVTVVGIALEGASVGVVNERTLEGTITTSPTDACKSVCMFTAKLAADSGDSLRVWQFFDTDGAQEVQVPQR
jgi:hypothetical protein